MNNRHRRVTKLRKQELNAKFEKEYGVSVKEAYKVLSQWVADASNAIRKFGISILDIKWEDTE